MKAYYVRVSAAEQNTARQETDTAGFEVFTDRCSGSIAFADRPAGARVMEALAAGELERLEVHSLDRLGRNLLDSLSVVEKFTDAGVPVHIRKEALTTLNANGKPNQTTALLLGILGSVAQSERETLLERQAEGIAIAKARGVYKGRPGHGAETVKKFLAKDKSQKIKKALKAKKSHRDIAARYSCSLATVAKVKYNMGRDGGAMATKGPASKFSTETRSMFDADPDR